MFKYRFEVGDWSNDGHGRCESVLVDTNHIDVDIHKAYQRFVKKNKISVINDYKIQNTKNERFCKDEEQAMPIEDWLKLKEAGVDLSKFVDNYLLQSEGREAYYFDEGPPELVMLYLEMAKVNLPDLEYKIIEENEIPVFGSHTFGIGYGSFI